MRRALGLAIATLVAALPAHGQRWTLDQSVQSQIDEVFDFVRLGDPGCVVGVSQYGRLIFAKGYGLANLDWGIPLSPSSLLDIGSVSKQFTATAIALLDIDGVLSIDDDVRRWIPELPEYQRPITIRHLLNHTSGIRDYLTLMTLAGRDFDNVFDEFDGVELITRQRALNFESGSQYLYSNSGYLLLANIVRRATGKSLRQFLEERVFDPLGMVHTSIWDDNAEILHQRAIGYSGSHGDWSIDHAWNFQMGGDGQVITSVEDMARWDANFYNGVVGGQELLDRLLTRGVLNNGDTIDYALGLTVGEYRGLRRVSHGGAWAGFRATMARLPDLYTTIIIECNRGDANTADYANAVADAVLAGHFPVAQEEAEAAAGPRNRAGEPVELSRVELARWEGVYQNDQSATVLAVELVDTGLVLTVEGQTLPLKPLSTTEFEVTGVGIRLEFSMVDGVATATARDNRFVRLNRPEPTVDELRVYVGRYWSPEIDATYEIALEGDSLVLRRPGHDPASLMPLRAGEFHGGDINVTFLREGDDVTGLRVSAGRVRGIVFQRGGPERGR